MIIDRPLKKCVARLELAQTVWKTGNLPLIYTHTKITKITRMQIISSVLKADLLNITTITTIKILIIIKMKISVVNYNQIESRLFI